MSGPTEGPYHRDGRTVYALQESGDYRCPMINRWSAHVQSAPGTPDDELEAVAVLFEAAPALLAACKALTGSIVQETEHGFVYALSELHAAVESARAAIAAAEPKP